MKLIDFIAKTNWKFIAIMVVLGFLAGGLMLMYQSILSRPEATRFFKAEALEEIKVLENGSLFYLSPNARYLVYFNGKSELVLEELELRTKEVVQTPVLKETTLKSSDVAIPKWSSDSRYLLFLTDSKLHIFDVQSKTRRELPIYPLSKNYEWFGNQIVYLCHEGRDTPSAACLISLNGELINRIPLNIESSLFSQRGDLPPIFFSTSPSGEYAVFYTISKVRRDEKGDIVPYSSVTEGVLIDKNGHIIKKLMHNQTIAFLKISWSPDGTQFVYNPGFIAVESTKVNEGEKAVSSGERSDVYFTWTKRGIFVDNSTEFIRIDPKTLEREMVSYDVRHDLKYELPKYRSYLFSPRPIVSPSGRFIVETFGTHPTFTLDGEAPKYIRLAAKDMLSGKIVELMWDTLLEGGGTEESYSFHFADSNLLVVVRKQDYHVANFGFKTRYFIYKIDLSSAPDFSRQPK